MFIKFSWCSAQGFTHRQCKNLTIKFPENQACKVDEWMGWGVSEILRNNRDRWPREHFFHLNKRGTRTGSNWLFPCGDGSAGWPDPPIVFFKTSKNQLAIYEKSNKHTSKQTNKKHICNLWEWLFVNPSPLREHRLCIFVCFVHLWSLQSCYNDAKCRDRKDWVWGSLGSGWQGPCSICKRVSGSWHIALKSCTGGTWSGWDLRVCYPHWPRHWNRALEPPRSWKEGVK